MKRSYEAQIGPDGSIRLFCRFFGNVVEVTDAGIFDIALPFILKQQTDVNGSRFLSPGQAAIVDSAVDARLRSMSEESDAEWQHAAVVTACKYKSMFEVSSFAKGMCQDEPDASSASSASSAAAPTSQSDAAHHDGSPETARPTKPMSSRVVLPANMSHILRLVLEHSELPGAIDGIGAASATVAASDRPAAERGSSSSVISLAEFRARKSSAAYVYKFPQP